MRHIKKSKIIMLGLVSGLLLALSANPAKAADIRIGVGFNLGHHHDYYSRYHHAPVISYSYFDHHDRHYYKKHHKHWKKHGYHNDRYARPYGYGYYNKDYRHKGKHAGYSKYRNDSRYHGKRDNYRDSRHHDRYSGYRSYHH